MKLKVKDYRDWNVQLRETGISGNHGWVAYTLLSISRYGRPLQFGVREMAKQCNITEPTLRTTLRELERQGHIKVEKVKPGVMKVWFNIKRRPVDKKAIEEKRERQRKARERWEDKRYRLGARLQRECNEELEKHPVPLETAREILKWTAETVAKMKRVRIDEWLNSLFATKLLLLIARALRKTWTSDESRLHDALVMAARLISLGLLHPKINKSFCLFGNLLKKYPWGFLNRLAVLFQACESMKPEHFERINNESAREEFERYYRSFVNHTRAYQKLCEIVCEYSQKRFFDIYIRTKWDNKFIRYTETQTASSGKLVKGKRAAN